MANGKIVLVLSCGHYEMDNLDPLVSQIESFARSHGREFAGALLRPHGLALRFMIKMGIKMDDVFSAAHEAGRQLAKDGEMSPKTLKIVSRDLVPLNRFLQLMNQTYEQRLDAIDGR